MEVEELEIIAKGMYTEGLIEIVGKGQVFINKTALVTDGLHIQKTIKAKAKQSTKQSVRLL